MPINIKVPTLGIKIMSFSFDASLYPSITYASSFFTAMAEADYNSKQNT